MSGSSRYYLSNDVKSVKSAVALGGSKIHQYNLPLDQFTPRINATSNANIWHMAREPSDGESQGGTQMPPALLSADPVQHPPPHWKDREGQQAPWFGSLGYLFTWFLTYLINLFCNCLSYIPTAFSILLPLPFVYSPTGEICLNGEAYPSQQTIQNYPEPSSKSFSSLNSP